MYIHIRQGSEQEQYKNSVLFISIDILSRQRIYVHVDRVDGREKTSLTGQPGGRVRCTTRQQKQPTSGEQVESRSSNLDRAKHVN